MTYRELSAKTGQPVTVLSRYAKGHVLPNIERAQHFLQVLTKLVGLDDEIRSRIKFDKGHFDNTEIIGDHYILQQAANYVLASFAGKRVTKVLTATTDGIPLATMVANALGVNLIVAKHNKKAGIKNYLTETYFIGRDTDILLTLYIPKEAIKKHDSLLIVDDIIRSGEPQEALINLTKKARAEVAGLFTLATIGEEWKKRIKDTQEFPLVVVTHIKNTSNNHLF
jgi:adenine phosphoribosyltransferase